MAELPLVAVPSDHAIGPIAREMTTLVPGSELGRGSPGLARLCSALRVRVHIATPRSISRRHAAVLHPAVDGWFDIYIQAMTGRASIGDSLARDQQIRFLVAHELGHTLFYQQSNRPVRPSMPSADEERFCDLFAERLLGLAADGLWSATEGD